MLTSDITHETNMPVMRFLSREVENRDATIENGKASTLTVDHITIYAPGGRDCSEFLYSEWIANKKLQVQQGRIPPAWIPIIENGYNAWKNGQEIPLEGVPIKTWPSITTEQRDRIIRANVLTVEQLAIANDQALNTIGPGAVALRDKAKFYMQSIQEHGKVAETMAAQKTQIDNLTSIVEELKAQLALIPQAGKK